MNVVKADLEKVLKRDLIAKRTTIKRSSVFRLQIIKAWTLRNL